MQIVPSGGKRRKGASFRRNESFLSLGRGKGEEAVEPRIRLSPISREGNKKASVIGVGLLDFKRKGIQERFSFS